MAKSKFEYVKDFEEFDKALPNTYMLVRIDGKGFTKFCDAHKLEKPNDIRGIDLMNFAAKAVMEDFQDIFLAYGQSDEYSFCFKKDSTMYQRRKDKITTCLVSCFTSHYVLNFTKIFEQEQKSVPSFDGRLVCYPSETNIVDYFRWRQCDCHINNLHNTTFWTLVQKGKRTNTQAGKELDGSFSKDKNQILFEFGVNYNQEPEVYKRGSLVLREMCVDQEKMDKMLKLKEEKPDLKISMPKKKEVLAIKHEDIIKGKFWETYFPEIYDRLEKSVNPNKLDK